MKKCVTLIYFFASISFAWPGANQKILECLGKEEKRFHLKKERGPIYDLNQRLISELVQIPDIDLRPEDLVKICSSKQFSESWKLLLLTIKKGKDLFIIPENVSVIQKNMILSLVEEYLEESREILLRFISQIQTLSPTPTCLKKEIPEIDELFTELKYLQTEVETQKLFKGKDEKIFNRLKNYPLAFERCRARMKKKAKSGSIAPDK